MDQLLTVESLSVDYRLKQGNVKAVRDVSFSLEMGECLGIAGESGSGKSTVAYSIVQLLARNAAIRSGDIRFKGKSLFSMNSREINSHRGKNIALVPQNASASLNPRMTVREQIMESIQANLDLPRKEARDEVVSVLEDVNMPDIDYNLTKYPHELSGGMKQRVLLAIMLACKPDLLILDEPTTGIDVSTQVQILNVINDLKQSLDMGILLITHDLSVISFIADSIGMLYAGELLEKGSVNTVFRRPAHPYTRALLDTIPTENNGFSAKPIDGQIPDLRGDFAGCIFADRCQFVEEECRNGSIEYETMDEEPDHLTKCWKPDCLQEGHLTQT